MDDRYSQGNEEPSLRCHSKALSLLKLLEVDELGNDHEQDRQQQQMKKLPLEEETVRDCLSFCHPRISVSQSPYNVLR